MIQFDDYTIQWPKSYKPLPPGYRVDWVESVEHYIAFGPNGIESPIHCDRFALRRWCFAHDLKHRPRSKALELDDD